MTAFQAKEISYFNLYLNNTYKKGNIIQLKKNIYYYDVHLFLEQAKSAAIVKDLYIIQISLHIYLQDFTQQ